MSAPTSDPPGFFMIDAFGYKNIRILKKLKTTKENISSYG